MDTLQTMTKYMDLIKRTFLIILFVMIIFVIYTTYSNHNSCNEIYKTANQANDMMKRFMDIANERLSKEDKKHIELSRSILSVYHRIEQINKTLVSTTKRIDWMDYDIYQIILLLNDKIVRINDTMQCKIFQMLT